MRITVFGATGGIGGHVVRQALDEGLAVTAVVRDPARFSLRHPALEVVAVPGLTDPAPLVPALKGSDAALSGVGPHGPRDVTVASRTIRGILRALGDAGVLRFVAVSATPVGPVPGEERWFGRRVAYPLFRTLMRGICTDLATMEAEIRGSEAEWTVVRPPRLVGGPLTKAYRTAIGANVPNSRTISRADVAHAMLAALTDPATVRQAVGVAR